jgi:hypothetical protein
MNGQWIGAYEGTNVDLLVVDLDDAGDHYEGTAAAIDHNVALPPTFAKLDNVPKGQKRFTLEVPLAPIDRQTALPTTWENVRQQYPDGLEAATKAMTDWTISGDEIHVSWRTDVETRGNGVVHKSRASAPSELVPLAATKTWEEFRQFARQLEPYQFIFRGQRSNQWRLRTSFHRKGRCSLLKFMTQDIPILHRHLSGLMTHPLDLRDGVQNAAFYNLIQHHGYPTPLLDWTYSHLLVHISRIRTHPAQQQQRTVFGFLCSTNCTGASTLSR